MEMESTTLTVQEILELEHSNMLHVNQEYQRGPVWSKDQKRRLIDSILRGYPLPLIYLNYIKKHIAGLSSEHMEVIDGQQRIDALVEFRERNLKLFDPTKEDKVAKFPKFIKDTPCPWAGKTFDALQADLKERFLLTKLQVAKITVENHLEARDLFIRLQSGLPLNGQEKRDAWPGGFTEFVLTFAGKPGIQRYPGHDFFSNLIGGQSGSARGKARQLCAQMAMLLFEQHADGNLVDLNTDNLDNYYHRNIDFDPNGIQAQRFERVLDKLMQLLGDGLRRKLKGHEAIHLMLLVDSLLKDYTKDWEQRFAKAFDKFTYHVNQDKLTRHTTSPGEFWTQYDAHTRTNSADARTIRVRHTFFLQKMSEFLSPLILIDPNRNYDPIEREIIYYRDDKRCAFCGKEIAWEELDIHHIHPHTLGGRTTFENGRAVHRDCHPRGEHGAYHSSNQLLPIPTVPDSQININLPDGPVDSNPRRRGRLGGNFPPDGTQCQFTYKEEKFSGQIINRALHVDRYGSCSSFSGASGKVTGTSRNGWDDWELKLPGANQWILAKDWRNSNKRSI